MRFVVHFSMDVWSWSLTVVGVILLIGSALGMMNDSSNVKALIDELEQGQVEEEEEGEEERKRRQREKRRKKKLRINRQEEKISSTRFILFLHRNKMAYAGLTDIGHF